MIHYECHVCAVTATCVVTPSSSLAWLDHMEAHADRGAFSSWTWSVEPLNFSA